MSRPLRIGIYSGTFNPVHSGHVTFALQALQTANLDKVYFLPERRPRYKQNVEHYGHRIAMIRQALHLHPKLDVLETDDVSFTVTRTLPRLERRFTGAELVFLMGSDVSIHMSSWPNIELLLERSELAIGLRAGTSWHDVRLRLSALPATPRAVHVVESYAPHVSSKKVRQGLRERRYVHGLLASVARYSNKNWLYVSLS